MANGLSGLTGNLLATALVVTTAGMAMRNLQHKRRKRSKLGYLGGK